MTTIQLIPESQRALAAEWLQSAHIALQLSQKAIESKSELTLKELREAEHQSTIAGCKLGLLISMLEGNPMPRTGE